MRGVRSVGVAAVAVLVLAPPVAAHAVTSPPPPLPLSCVDLNNNGICEANDPPLAAVLVDGFLDTTVAQNGYVPTGNPTGIVLNSFTSTDDNLTLYATGNVHINGRMKETGYTSVDIETPEDITIGANASLTFGKSHCCMSGLTLYAHDLTIGSRAQVRVGGDDSSWDIEARNIAIGDGVRLTAQGSDTSTGIAAAVSLTLGLNDQVKTPTTGSFQLTSAENIFATGLHVTSGDIDIEAQPSNNSHIGPRTLSLTNSVVNQTSVDGSLTLYGGDPSRPVSGNKVLFVQTIVRARGFVDIEPQPTTS
jgi:hypothetical protein